LRERVKLAFAGVVSIAIAVGKQGDLVGDPDIVFAGLPSWARITSTWATWSTTRVQTFDTLPRARRRDFDSVATAIERAVRGAVYASWGKKPLVHVLVVAAEHAGGLAPTSRAKHGDSSNLHDTRLE